MPLQSECSRVEAYQAGMERTSRLYTRTKTTEFDEVTINFLKIQIISCIFIDFIPPMKSDQLTVRIKLLEHHQRLWVDWEGFWGEVMEVV